MFKILAENPCLSVLKELLPTFPQTGQVCLVGGAVRDLLLGKPATDFDFTSAQDPTPLARAVARRLAGHWFWLDESRRQSRILVDGQTCDFAPWRAATLAGDLAARDFTINALAVDLSVESADMVVIDPLGGREDLSRGVLRQAGPGVLADDPLRILKGIRHAAELGLAVEAGTLRAMQTSVPALAAVAVERLRAEVWKILAAPDARGGMRLLSANGAGAALFGPQFDAAQAEVACRLADLEGYFAMLAQTSPVYAGWLAEPVVQDLDRAGLLRWCHVLGAIDAALPAALAARWRFSRTASARIQAIVNFPPHLSKELTELPPSPRPVVLWALGYGPDPVDLLLALGLRMPPGEGGLSQVFSALRLLAGLPNPWQVAPLLDGHWIMAELGLTGDEVGTALTELRLAEIRGEVADAEEARRFLLSRQRKNG